MKKWNEMPEKPNEICMFYCEIAQKWKLIFYE